MIFDSRKWRRQLRDTAASLARRAAQTRWAEASFNKLEQELMLSFYTVRKLIESHQTNAALQTQNFAGRAYPSIGHPVSYVIWPDISAKYDLSNATAYATNARTLANQFIHSFIYRPTRAADGGLSGVFVASDWEKDQRVFWFAVATLCSVLTAVASSRSGGFRVAPEKNDMLFP